MRRGFRTAELIDFLSGRTSEPTITPQTFAAIMRATATLTFVGDVAEERELVVG